MESYKVHNIAYCAYAHKGHIFPLGNVSVSCQFVASDAQCNLLMLVKSGWAVNKINQWVATNTLDYLDYLGYG